MNLRLISLATQRRIGKWRRRLVRVSFALFFLVTFANATSVFAAASGRSIAILYDDSRSMGGSAQAGRWVGANFSMQVFAALLAASDELLLVKMNRQQDVNAIQASAISML